jgi:hypothetical protein
MRLARRAGALLCAVAIGPWLLLQTAASAATNVVHLKSAHKNVTAQGFKGHNCDRYDGSGLDMWHFVLPGNDGHFVKVTATFSTGDVVVVGPFDQPTDKHAYVYSSVGATLLDATAEINGTTKHDEFVLSHTCPGSEDQEEGVCVSNPDAPECQEPSCEETESCEEPSCEETQSCEEPSCEETQSCEEPSCEETQSCEPEEPGRAVITIYKVYKGSQTHRDGWQFTAEAPGESDVTINDDGRKDSETTGGVIHGAVFVVEGQLNEIPVTITETQKPGWALDGVSCTFSQGGDPQAMTVNRDSVKVDVEPGNSIACTFTNKEVRHSSGGGGSYVPPTEVLGEKEGPAPTPTPPTKVEGGKLPYTGAPVAKALTLSSALLAAGALLLLATSRPVRRRG